MAAGDMKKPQRQRLVAELAHQPNNVIAEALGVSSRTIERDRNDLGLPAARRALGPVHGTAGGFNRGCRCEPCVTARAAHEAAQRRSRYRRGLAEGDPRHGTSTGYRNWGCLCLLCAAWGSLDNARQKAGRRTGPWRSPSGRTAPP